MSSALTVLLGVNLSGGVLVLFVLGLRRLCLQRLPKLAFWGLWLIVLLRFLCPCFLTVRVPAAELPQFAVTQTEEPRQAELPIFDSQPGALSEIPAASGFSESAAADSVAALNPAAVFAALWLAGAAVILRKALREHRRFRQLARQSLPINSAWAETWRQEHRLFRPYDLRWTDQISCPLTYGIFRPVLLLPLELLGETVPQRELLLEHEWVHIRRWDTLNKLLLLLVKLLYWYNPAVWLLCRYAPRDMELSCDELVLRHRDSAARRAYCLQLLHFAAPFDFPSNPSASGFNGSKLEERIESIMKKRKFTKLTALLLVLSLLVCIGSFTALAAEEPADSSTEAQSLITEEPLEEETPTISSYVPGEVLYFNQLEENGEIVTEVIQSWSEFESLPEDGIAILAQSPVSTAGYSWTQPEDAGAYLISVENDSDLPMKITVTCEGHAYAFVIPDHDSDACIVPNAWSGSLHELDFATEDGTVSGTVSITAFIAVEAAQAAGSDAAASENVDYGLDFSDAEIQSAIELAQKYYSDMANELIDESAFSAEEIASMQEWKAWLKEGVEISYQKDTAKKYIESCSVRTCIEENGAGTVIILQVNIPATPDGREEWQNRIIELNRADAQSEWHVRTEGPC